MRKIWHELVHGYRFEIIDAMPPGMTVWRCARCGHKRVSHIGR